MTIRRLRLVAFLGFLFLVAASVAVTFAALRAQRDDALVINLAGRQRMLSQQMTLQVLGVQVGANPAYREALHNTAHAYFEATLEALIAGGPAPYVDGTTVTLPPTRNPEILAQLETVRATWVEMHPAIMAVLEEDPQSVAFAEAVATVERLAPTLLSQMDEAVRLYEAEAARKVARVQALQIGFLVAAAGLLVAAFFLAERWVLNPIARLGAAARRIGEGDLDTPVSVAGPGEIARLTRSFDDMRRNLAAADLSAHLLDSMLDAVVVANPDGTVRMMNGAALELLGCTAAEVAGQPVGRFFAEEEEEEEEEVTFFRGTGLARLVREGAAREVETTLITRAGERVPVVFNGSVVRDAGGGLVAVVGVARDMRPTRRLIYEAQARAAESHALKTIAEVLNREVGLQEALDRSLEAVMAVIGSEAGWILLNEQSGFTLAAARNLPPALEADDRAEMRWPGCTCQRKLLAGELTAAANILECQRLQQARGDTRGLRHHASVPIHIEGRALGNLNLTTPAGRTFTESELNLLTAVGDQVGVAIERARLHEQVKTQRIEEQSALLRLSQTLLGESEPQAMMDLAARVAAAALRVELAAVALVDPDGQSYSGRAFVGWPPEIFQQTQRIPLAASTGLGYAIQTRKPAVVPDESRETRFGAPPWVAEIGIVSSLLVPMLVGGKVIGGLVVNSRTPRDWSDDDVRLLSLVANDAAQALGRARQHAHAVERLERISALHDIDVAITSPLSLQATLDVLLEKVAERLHVDAAAVALIQPETRELVYAARRGLDGEFFVDGLLKVKEGIAGQVAHTGQVAAIPDVSAEPGFVRAAIAERLGIVSYLAVPLRARGEIIGVLELATRQPHTFPPEEVDFFVTLAGQAAIVIDNSRMYEEAVRRAAQQRALAECAGGILATLDVGSLWPAVTDAARQVLTADRAAIYVYHAEADRLTCPYASGLSAGYVAEINRRFHEVPGGRLLADPRPVVIADAQTDPAAAPVRDLITREGYRSYAVFPLAAPDLPLGAFVIYRDKIAPFTPDDIAAGQTLAHVVSVALQNARLFAETRRRAEELEALAEVSSALRVAPTRADMLPVMLDQVLALFHADSAALALRDADSGETVIELVRGLAAEMTGMRLPPGEGISGHVIAAGQPYVSADMRSDPRLAAPTLPDELRAAACVPLIAQDQTIGALWLARRTAVAAAEVRLLTAIADMAANAIRRAALHDETEQRLRLVEALRNIDMAITASLDLRVTLSVFLDQAMAQLRVDAAAVLLLNPHTHILEYAAGRGFRTRAIERSRLRLGEGYAGRAALERRAIHLPDVSGVEDFLRASFIRGEDFAGYYVTPLVVKGHVKGVLEIFHRAPLHLSQIWLSFLEALAAQASIAIDNAVLFDDLQRSAAELALAYDTTLEGWARALELRDRETEGHTRRVTETTERLAGAMGITGESLVHIRRGSLLHDIGKMGVPDSILLKPGKLTEEEWMVMRLHPRLAYELLAPIAYLRPALDIPYCHHEKWDGSGYPRGLVGEQIPLAARIFAVVDVWDALRSDRPYREGWPEERVREYIREQAGAHFDPRVVEVFLRIQ